jgi:hypothetical protein
MILYLLQLILGAFVLSLLAMVILLPYMALRWAVRKFCYRVLGLNVYTNAEKKLIGIFKETDDPYYYLGGDYRRAQEELVIVKRPCLIISDEEVIEYRTRINRIQKYRRLK